MGDHQERPTFEELVRSLETAGTRAVVLYERLAGAIEQHLSRDHLKTQLLCAERGDEVVRLRRLLDLARRPLVDHEKGEECIIELEPGETEPTCWVCKLRDETDPDRKAEAPSELDLELVRADMDDFSVVRPRSPAARVTLDEKLDELRALRDKLHAMHKEVESDG